AVAADAVRDDAGELLAVAEADRQDVALADADADLGAVADLPAQLVAVALLGDAAGALVLPAVGGGAPGGVRVARGPGPGRGPAPGRGPGVAGRRPGARRRAARRRRRSASGAWRSWVSSGGSNGRTSLHARYIQPGRNTIRVTCGRAPSPSRPFAAKP